MAAGPGLGVGPAVPPAPPTLPAQTPGGPPSWGLGLTSLGVGICPPDSSSPDRGCEGARPPPEIEASSPPGAARSVWGTLRKGLFSP